METEFKADVFFYLTGKRRDFGPDSIEGLSLRPALLARFRELEKLRYDFPLVLLDENSSDTWVRSLSEIFDKILEAVGPDAGSDRLTQHGLRIERQIRTLLAQGAAGSLSALWNTAASQLSGSDDLFHNSVERLSGLRALDGEVVGCDAATPGRLLRHAWETVQRRKARRFQERRSRLVGRLSDLLRADFARSAEGLSPDRLRASVGPRFQDTFDFDVMSRLLTTASSNGFAHHRNRRIEWMLSVLRAQRFFPAFPDPSPSEEEAEPYSFVFESCSGAVRAYRERLPEMVELAKVLAMAELEIEGRYEETRHDAFFEDFDQDSLDTSEAALFPDYFVSLPAQQLSAVEAAAATEALSAGFPVKVLVQTDEFRMASAPRNAELGFGLPSNRIASALMGGTVFVLQSASSALFQLRDPICRGMEQSGPALFSIFSGAAESTDRLPPYLVAAAAMESRAFPAFVYDPSAGPDWASRFSLQPNPQPEVGWPVHAFDYEDGAHQNVSENLAFTLVDFLACDPRYAPAFAKAPRSAPNTELAAVSEHLQGETSAGDNRVPYILMCDVHNSLQKVMVTDKLVRETRSCRDLWRSLQELAGIHNSHAERLLARERRSWEDELHRQAPVPPGGEPRGESAADSMPAVSPPAESPAPEAALSPDAPYIETRRCTTCNECIDLNHKMFAYNGEKQAFIADPDAGTYRQLVEAAENCPVSIIHPGKPRNPSESGLEELLERAAPFL